MSTLFSGFITRQQQQNYDNLIEQLIGVLCKRIQKFYDGSECNEHSFKMILLKIIVNISILEEKKHAQPKLSTQVKDLMSVLQLDQIAIQVIQNQINGKQKKKDYVLINQSDLQTKKVNTIMNKGRSITPLNGINPNRTNQKKEGLQNSLYQINRVSSSNANNNSKQNAIDGQEFLQNLSSVENSAEKNGLRIKVYNKKEEFGYGTSYKKKQSINKEDSLNKNSLSIIQNDISKEVHSNSKDLNGHSREVYVKTKDLQSNSKELKGNSKVLQGSSKEFYSQSKDLYRNSKELYGYSKDLNGSIKDLSMNSKELMVDSKDSSFVNCYESVNVKKILNNSAQNDYNSGQSSFYNGLEANGTNNQSQQRHGKVHFQQKPNDVTSISPPPYNTLQNTFNSLLEKISENNPHIAKKIDYQNSNYGTLSSQKDQNNIASDLECPLPSQNFPSEQQSINISSIYNNNNNIIKNEQNSQSNSQQQSQDQVQIDQDIIKKIINIAPQIDKLSKQQRSVDKQFRRLRKKYQQTNNNNLQNENKNDFEFDADKFEQDFYYGNFMSSTSSCSKQFNELFKSNRKNGFLSAQRNVHK